MSRDLSHPVWDVYDLYRTSRLNVKYFRCRHSQLKKLNFAIEFILAATTSTTVLALTFWKTSIGSMVWQILCIISALLAIIKPMLKLTERICKIEEAIAGYVILENDLKMIEVEIRHNKNFSNEMQDKFKAALERIAQLNLKYEDTELRKLKKQCQNEVLNELPPEYFYIP